MSVDSDGDDESDKQLVFTGELHNTRGFDDDESDLHSIPGSERV